MLDVKMTNVKDDDDAATRDFGFKGKTREVTSQSHHACFTYVTAILCVTTVVTCLVFIRDVRHRQTLVEQKLGFDSDGELACCKCCPGHVLEPQEPHDQGHVGNVETAEGHLLSNTFFAYLRKNAQGDALPGHRASPPAKEDVPILQAARESNSGVGGMELGRGEGERSPGRQGQGRSRRDVEYSTIMNRTTTETEADEIITRSFGLTSVTPSHLHRSNTVAKVKKEVGTVRDSTQKHPINKKKVEKRSRSGKNKLETTTFIIENLDEKMGTQPLYLLFFPSLKKWGVDPGSLCLWLNYSVRRWFFCKSKSYHSAVFNMSMFQMIAIQCFIQAC